MRTREGGAAVWGHCGFLFQFTLSLCYFVIPFISALCSECPEGKDNTHVREGGK